MIRLLHLSDLHFGEHSRFQGEDSKELGERFYQGLLANYEAFKAAPPDLVIVTGDFAEVGKPAEFRLASQFLETLGGELGVVRERFVFCPGNHDIWRPACRSVQENEQAAEEFDDDELRMRMDRVKLKHYDAFVENFYGEPQERVADALDYGGFVYTYPELRLTVASLNSCEKESHRDEDHVGFVSRKQGQALMSQWLKGEVASYLKIIAVHHNPKITVQTNLDHQLEWLKGKELSRDLIAAFKGDALGFDSEGWIQQIGHDCRVPLLL
ncbi:MAG: metallophosphoesterase, partial [Acidobacteriota bacterium]